MLYLWCLWIQSVHYLFRCLVHKLFLCKELFYTTLKYGYINQSRLIELSDI